MRTHRVRGVVVALGLLAMLTGSAMAWQPSGWVYFNWPYAYDHASQDWYWFSPQITFSGRTAFHRPTDGSR
jgi:hypothetical protein